MFVNIAACSMSMEKIVREGILAVLMGCFGMLTCS